MNNSNTGIEIGSYEYRRSINGWMRIEGRTEDEGGKRQYTVGFYEAPILNALEAQKAEIESLRERVAWLVEALDYIKVVVRTAQSSERRIQMIESHFKALAEKVEGEEINER